MNHVLESLNNGCTVCIYDVCIYLPTTDKLKESIERWNKLISLPNQLSIDPQNYLSLKKDEGEYVLCLTCGSEKVCSYIIKDPYELEEICRSFQSCKQMSITGI